MGTTVVKKTKNQHPTIERDISWMYFNHRILQEAQREDVPLLERLSFLGIYSNNLDEFFRVRVATLSRIAETDNRQLETDSKVARETNASISKLNEVYSKEFEQTVGTVMKALETKNIFVVDDKQLTTEQQEFVKSYFYSQLNGRTLPVLLDQINSFADFEDDVIYLAIRLLKWDDDKKKPAKADAVVKVPAKKLGRFLRLPDTDGKSYVMYLDDVIRFCLPMMFSGLPYNEYEAYAFKFTKDAEMEMDNDLDAGRMQKVQKGVKSRRKGVPMRVIYDENMPKSLIKKVMAKLNLDKLDTAQAGGRYHNHKDLMSFPSCGHDNLKYDKWPSIQHPDFNRDESIFDTIRRKDLFLHVPYYSFNGYLRFLREAALNPQVKEIKTTLYRLAKDSKVVESLITAARNGKKVTVVIELLARFDEASNISWSEKMQDAGVNVLFGVEGLKIHSKITLVRTTSGSYAVVGTGNFHEGNAKIYTDCILFTARKAIVKDVERVFEFIHSPFIQPRFKELLVSPNNMKEPLIKLIDREAANALAGKPSSIKIKMNHITDPDMVKHLYHAAEVGVPVEIVLRGNCSIVSTDIKMHGIIDRYLEHSRILIFENGGEPLFYIGSADWMPRNLCHRIEVLTPIYDVEIQKQLRQIVDFGLMDTSQGRVVDGTGTNAMWKAAEGAKPFRSQLELYLSASSILSSSALDDTGSEATDKENKD